MSTVQTSSGASELNTVELNTCNGLLYYLQKRLPPGVIYMFSPVSLLVRSCIFKALLSSCACL